jgi:hypothetical protein
MLEIIAINETLQQIISHVGNHHAIGVTLWDALDGLEVKRKRASDLFDGDWPFAVAH